MSNNACGNTLPTCNDYIVQYYKMKNLKNIYTISSIFEDDESKNITNELKIIWKLQYIT